MKKTIFILFFLFCYCESEKTPVMPENLQLAGPTPITGELLIGTMENGIKLGWCHAYQKPMIIMYKDGEERVQISSDFIHFKKDGRMIMEIRPEELEYGFD